MKDGDALVGKEKEKVQEESEGEESAIYRVSLWSWWPALCVRKQKVTFCFVKCQRLRLFHCVSMIFSHLWAVFTGQSRCALLPLQSALKAKGLAAAKLLHRNRQILKKSSQGEGFIFLNLRAWVLFLWRGVMSLLFFFFVSLCTASRIKLWPTTHISCRVSPSYSHVCFTLYSKYLCCLNSFSHCKVWMLIYLQGSKDFFFLIPKVLKPNCMGGLPNIPTQLWSFKRLMIKHQRVEDFVFEPFIPRQWLTEYYSVTLIFSS